MFVMCSKAFQSSAGVCFFDLPPDGVGVWIFCGLKAGSLGTARTVTDIRVGVGAPRGSCQSPQRHGDFFNRADQRECDLFQLGMESW